MFLEISYKIKNSVEFLDDFTQAGRLKDGLTFKNGIYGGSIEEFRLFGDLLLDETAELRDKLYRNRAYIDDTTFDNLHQLKRLTQNFIILGDVFTRDFIENTVNQPWRRRFKEYDEFKVRSKSNRESIVEVFVKIEKKIKEKLNTSK